MKQASYLSLLAAAVAAASVLGLPACATPSDPCNAVLPDAPTSLVWPAAPDQARVAYVGVLQDNNACALAPTETPLALQYPKAISAASDGHVIVSDRAGVFSVDPKTGHMSAFANAKDHEVRNSRGLATTSDGKVLVVDAERRAVLVYSNKNAYLAQIGSEADFVRPQGVAVDEKLGRVYVADAGRDAVLAFALDGSFLFSIESTESQVLGVPSQVAVNSKGEIFVVHQGAPKILVFGSDGAFLRAFGAEGTFPGQFVRPKGIAIDSEDHVYVSDAAFDNIQIFDGAGQLLLPIGQGGTGKGEFNLPFMMAIDSHDRIFVAEYGNHRVQVLQYLGGKQAK